MYELAGLAGQEAKRLPPSSCLCYICYIAGQTCWFLTCSGRGAVLPMVAPVMTLMVCTSVVCSRQVKAGQGGAWIDSCMLSDGCWCMGASCCGDVECKGCTAHPQSSQSTHCKHPLCSRPSFVGVRTLTCNHHNICLYELFQLYIATPPQLSSRTQQAHQRHPPVQTAASHPACTSGLGSNHPYGWL